MNGLCSCFCVQLSFPSLVHFQHTTCKVSDVHEWANWQSFGAGSSRCFWHLEDFGVPFTTAPWCTLPWWSTFVGWNIRWLPSSDRTKITNSGKVFQVLGQHSLRYLRSPHQDENATFSVSWNLIVRGSRLKLSGELFLVCLRLIDVKLFTSLKLLFVFSFS